MKPSVPVLLLVVLSFGCRSVDRTALFVGSYRYHVLLDEPERTLELRHDGTYQMTVFPALVFSKSGEALPFIELGTWRLMDGSVILLSERGVSKKVAAKGNPERPSFEVEGVMFEREDRPNQSPVPTSGLRPAAAHL